VATQDNVAKRCWSRATRGTRPEGPSNPAASTNSAAGAASGPSGLALIQNTDPIRRAIHGQRTIEFMAQQTRHLLFPFCVSWATQKPVVSPFFRPIRANYGDNQVGQGVSPVLAILNGGFRPRAALSKRQELANYGRRSVILKYFPKDPRSLGC